MAERAAARREPITVTPSTPNTPAPHPGDQFLPPPTQLAAPHPTHPVPATSAPPTGSHEGPHTPPLCPVPPGGHPPDRLEAAPRLASSPPAQEKKKENNSMPPPLQSLPGQASAPVYPEEPF
jgi:hypothetical protein